MLSLAIVTMSERFYDNTKPYIIYLQMSVCIAQVDMAKWEDSKLAICSLLFDIWVHRVKNG